MERKDGEKRTGLKARHYSSGAEEVGITGGAEDVVDGGVVVDESGGFAGEQVDVESASAEKRE